MQSTKIVSLARACTRQYCSGRVSSHFQTMKLKQAKFQCDDGLPVFLKGGMVDKVLYQTTIALCLVGTGMMGKLFWDLARPHN